jgi:type VI secretion system protein VasG
LGEDVMKKIIHLKLGKVGKRVREHYKATFSYSPELVDTICQRCTEVDTGARNVDHILTRSLLPEMSAEFLARLAQGQTITRVQVGVTPAGAFQYVVE